jgi:hypothetical protein
MRSSFLCQTAHGPNYNFTGPVYYGATCREEDLTQPDLNCIFPSQHVADRHSKAAVDLIAKLDEMLASAEIQSYPRELAVEPVSELETQWILAVRALTSCPGIALDLAEETVGRPYADAMRNLHHMYPVDPDVAYAFAESLMVLNAWKLYEYPTGRPLSNDVIEIRRVLEESLKTNPDHPGLCHLYVHLLEMSDEPHKALQACAVLRTKFPDAGHLVHMPTHIGRLSHVGACLMLCFDGYE